MKKTYSSAFKAQVVLELLKEAFPVIKDGQDEFTPLLRTIDQRTQPALERTAA